MVGMDGNPLFAQQVAAAAKEKLNETLITPSGIEGNTYKDFLIKEPGISNLRKDGSDEKIGNGFLILMMQAQSCGWNDIMSFWATWYMNWLALKRSNAGWQQETFRTDRSIGIQDVRSTPLPEQSPRT